MSTCRRSSVRSRLLGVSLPTFVALGVIALSPASVSAQSPSTWTGGGGNASWSTAANWTTIPTTTGTYDLTFAGSSGTSNINDIGPINVSTLTFANNGTNSTSTFALSGSAIAFAPNALIQTAAISVSSTETLNLPAVVSGTTTFSLGANHRLNVFSPSLTGTGSLIKTGPAELAFFTAPTPLSSFRLDAGTLTFNDQATQNGVVGKTVTVNAGTINVGTGTTNFSVAINGNFNWRAYSGQSSTSTAVTFNTPTTTATNATITLLSTGTTVNGITGRIQDNTTRTVALIAALSGSSTFTLSGSSSFSGGTTVTSGTLIVSNANALGNGGLTVNTNGMLINNVNAIVNGGLAGGVNGVVASRTGASTLTVNTSGSSTYDGVLANNAGTLSFVKNGTGLQRLTGNSTYTGTTTVNSGTLAVDGSLGVTTTFVDVAAVLQGSGTIGGPATIQGTLSPGNSPGVITLGSVVLGGTSVTRIEIAGTTRNTQYDGVNITTPGGLAYGGTMALSFSSLFGDGTTFDIFSFTGNSSGAFTSVVSTGSYAGTWTNVLGSGTFELVSGGQTLTFSPSTGDIVVVPEPTAITLLSAGGLIVWGGVARRRRGRRANEDCHGTTSGGGN